MTNRHARSRQRRRAGSLLLRLLGLGLLEDLVAQCIVGLQARRRRGVFGRVVWQARHVVDWEVVACACACTRACARSAGRRGRAVRGRCRVVDAAAVCFRRSGGRGGGGEWIVFAQGIV